MLPQPGLYKGGGLVIPDPSLASRQQHRLLRQPFLKPHHVGACGKSDVTSPLLRGAQVRLMLLHAPGFARVHAAAEEGLSPGSEDEVPAAQIRWSVEWRVCTNPIFLHHHRFDGPQEV